MPTTVQKRPRPTSSAPNPAPPLKIVGVGASAGGLEAFTDFLKAVPSSEDLAYILVQHLDPTHRSLLVELLAKATSLNVREATDGMRVERNEIHIIPPNRELTIADGVLRLVPREKLQGGTRTIDIFLRSLAADQGPNAIAVILSGAGSDGAQGIKAVKEHGGATFAQLESSARYDSMPRAAIATGCVDFVLPAERIAAEIMRAVHRPSGAEERAATNVRKRKGRIGVAGGRPFGDDGSDGIDWPAAPTDVNLRKIFFLLRSRTGVDFSLYRANTVRRRLQRRLTVTKTANLDRYVTFLRRYPAEVDALYRDLLIHVTSFFRNPSVFEMLKRKIFPKLIKLHRDADAVRIWVAGCATGQEAYSLAIAYSEFADATGCDLPVQVFATDLSAEALDYARAGQYTAPEVQSLGKGRLKTHFTAEGDKFRVNKSLRDRLVFAQQNLLSQPPFTKVDLISCRNVMIYIETGMQQKLIPTFHYALRPAGYLLLGTSETVGQHASLFKAVERPHKIYRRLNTPSWIRGELPPLLPPAALPLPVVPARKIKPATVQEKMSLQDRLKVLQSAHDVSMEELQSSNEEVQSSNEELQSLNEELETSNEELESTNEELTTLNEELATRNEELRQSERVLREQAQLLDLAPVLVRSSKDRIVYWNRGAEKMYGFSKDEALGHISHILLDTQFPEPLARIQANLVRDGRWEGEVTHRRKDGSILSVTTQWVVHHDEKGKPRAVLEVNADISSRRRAEEALRTSEAFNRSILDSSPDSICLLDSVGRVKFMTGPSMKLLDIADFGAVADAYWPSLWEKHSRLEAEAAVRGAIAGQTARFQAPEMVGRGDSAGGKLAGGEPAAARGLAGYHRTEAGRSAGCGTRQADCLPGRERGRNRPGAGAAGVLAAAGGTARPAYRRGVCPLLAAAARFRHPRTLRERRPVHAPQRPALAGSGRPIQDRTHCLQRDLASDQRCPQR
jgi:PAS domain S-box-containing protein